MNSLFFVKSFLFFFILILMFIFELAYANLNISPAVVNIIAEPMSVCKNRYIVTNISDGVVTVLVTKEDWRNYSGNSSDISVDNWLKLEKCEFDIGPKESVEVPFEVVISKAMVGSVSGMIVFTIKGEMINFSMKQPVYVMIKDTEKIDFKIDSLIMSKSDRDGNIYYKMVVRNDGNVHIRHNGIIEIYNKETGILVERVVIEETFPVYAEDSRVFYGVVLKKNDLRKGEYIALFRINALGKEVVRKVKFKVSGLGEFATDGSGGLGFKGSDFKESVQVMLYEMKGLVKGFFRKLRSWVLSLDVSFR